MKPLFTAIEAYNRGDIDADALVEACAGVLRDQLAPDN
jgi:hypothetical protein